MNKYDAMDLYDFIEVESYIQCSRCATTHTTWGDNNEQHFFNAGWRATKKGNVYCPECAAKKLKINPTK